MPLWKRILFITLFLLAVAGIGFLIYQFFFAPTPAVERPVPIVEQPTGALPGAGPAVSTPTITPTAPQLPAAKAIPLTALAAKGGTVQVTEVQPDRSISPILSSNGNDLVSYDVFDGKFYTVTPDGTLTKLSDDAFVGAETITMNPQADKTVIEFPDGSNILYDFKTKKQVSLPQHWREFNFSPDGGQIAYKSYGIDPDNNWLAIANADGTEGQAIEPLGNRGAYVDVNWSPTGQVIATSRDGIDSSRQRILFLGKNKENFKSAVVNGRGFQYQYSPDGTQMLYSVYSPGGDYKPELWVMDSIGDEIGDNRRSLGIATWSNKCAFSDAQYVYCAVPPSLPTGAGLIQDAMDNADDVLVKINVSTGERTKLAETPTAQTISKVVVTKDQKTLYYTDKQTGRIFTMKLE